MRSYFEGRYFKQQAGGKTIGIIPAVHADRSGRRSVSIQVIGNNFSKMAVYPPDCCHADRKSGILYLGRSTFAPAQIRLDISEGGFRAEGLLFFSGLTPPCFDIMGPFAHVPLMECRHSIVSLRHTVDGYVSIDGKKTVFSGGTGYIEGDRGRSFPKRYIWTQSCFEKSNSLMLSVADIPFMGLQFTGVIAAVLFNGREYRIATYLGARVLLITDRTVAVRQGGTVLSAELLDAREQSLHAPVRGGMTRLIRECPSCRVRYRFIQNREILFDFISEEAGYENEWSAI